MVFRITVVAIVALGLALSANLFLAAQQPPADIRKAQPMASADRFEFEVVQSFQAKYEGDTPGHWGRNDGLGERRPQVALGDPVFRGDERIGQITELGWSRIHGSLEVEFNPIIGTRICVGDEVWLYLDARPVKK
jgi:hypothetical protein